MCGDPNSTMRFAFIEFLSEAAARQVSRTGIWQRSGPGSCAAGALRHPLQVQRCTLAGHGLSAALLLPRVQAQAMSGSLLGSNPIRVSPSKTAIIPVNNTYLPRSAGEREQVARTVYVANLDRGLETEAVKEYFENLCGEGFLLPLPPALLAVLCYLPGLSLRGGC